MLQKIILAIVENYGLIPEIAEKLVTFIDTKKIQGHTGGEASSRFGDYLGFLQIPDDQQMQQLFAERWTDHRVWIKVPKDCEEYLRGQTPLFTPPRMEPVYNAPPFYKAGLDKVEPGNNRNLHNAGTVRTTTTVTDDYSSFLVNEYLPEHFFMEIRNSEMDNVLSNGLPEVEYSNPYIFYTSIEEARASLLKDLISSGVTQVTRKMMHQYTLVRINANKIELNNDVFYTRTLHGHRTGSSSFGYYYVAEIKTSAVSVAKENISE